MRRYVYKEFEVYLSKSHLQKSESLTVDHASKIWRSNYLSGWGKLLTWAVLSIFIAVVYLSNLPSWSVFISLLFVHTFIAIPLASKEMYKSVEQLKNSAQ